MSPSRHIPGAVAWCRSVLLVGLLLAHPVLSLADDNARDWLERMGHALEHLNYEGTLVQLQGAEAAVMRIVHRVEDGVSTERITAMDEVGREIVRRGEDVTCILPDQRSVLVGKRSQAGSSGSPLRSQFATGPQFDESLYRLAIASGGRLVGRDTRLVTVQAMDRYRYGYRLWLDESTAMPLKVQIAGDDGVVVEQLLFSDIQLSGRIPEAATEPSMAHEDYTVRGGMGASQAEVSGGAAGWEVRTLPPGFRLHAARIQTEKGGAPVEQLVYSDGVASVSVFIEAGAQAVDEGGGPSRMGAANAYTLMRENHLVTAVGDVPLRTVEAIAREVQPVPPLAARR